MAEAGEDKHAEESEGETGTEDDDELHHEFESSSSSSSSKKKKKKKKQKKKAGNEAAGASSSHEGSAQAPNADKQEAERRFQRALDSAKHDEDMWVLLGNANIHDAKARKLCEALKNNSSITSVNLSANHIGEEGVKALVDVLGSGGCSELINLDLRGNTLSDGAQELLADLHKRRKQLVIETGPILAEPAASSDASSSSSNSSKPRTAAALRAAKAAAEQQQQQEQQQQGESLRDLAKHSAMFRRFFQTDMEEGTGSSGEEEVDQEEQLPPPEEVWSAITDLVPQGNAAVPELSQKLVAVTHALEVEMSAMPALEDNAQLSTFPPHFRAAVDKLEQLQQVLQLTPQPQINQCSRQSPQAAVGSHRVWTCAILHMLLLHNNPIIDNAIHAAGLLPVAMALALKHERCSALQCRVVEMLRCSLASSVKDLWQGLFREGYDKGLQQESGEPMPQLQQALMQLASSAVKQPLGTRSPAIGFAVEVANTLIQSCDASNTDSYCAELAELLNADQQWQRSIEPQGAIHTLLQEQDGQLCGPPPPRPAQSEVEDDMDGQSIPGLIKGGQLMQLLSRMADVSWDTAERTVG